MGLRWLALVAVLLAGSTAPADAVAPGPSCPVTLPDGSRPPGQPRTVPWYGNGRIWAGISRDGVYAVQSDQVAADGVDRKQADLGDADRDA